MALVLLGAALQVVAVPVAAAPAQSGGSPEQVAIKFDSQVGDVSDAQLEMFALATLNDPRSWGQAGFSFTSDPGSPYSVVLAEPAIVDELCAPLVTGGRVSCQNGPIVALNANRWRNTTQDWDQTDDDYRRYMVNHEVGHLIGQFHPGNRCPSPGEPAGVMEQQTKGLEGCTGNPWPLDWEVVAAARRPVAYAPTPDVEPAVRTQNPGGGVPGTLPDAGAGPTTSGVPLEPPTSAPPAPPSTSQDAAPATTESAAPTSGTAASTGSDPDADSEPAVITTRTVNQGTDSQLPLAVLLGFASLVAFALGGVIIHRLVRGRNQVDEGPGADDAPARPVWMDGGKQPDAHDEGWEAAGSVSVSGWHVTPSGPSECVGHVACVFPTRWSATEQRRLLSELRGVAPDADPRVLAEALVAVLKADRPLRPRPGEGLGAVLIGKDQLLVAVMGSAESTELRGGSPERTRKQGVARIRSGDGECSVSVDQTGNDWPQGRLVVERKASPPATQHDAEPLDGVPERIPSG